MASSTETLLQPGDLLYSEGGSNDCGYIVESGEILLFCQVDGQRFNCERRGPGSIVGELSILTGQPRTVSVEALTPCRLFRISAEQILDRFEKLDPVLRACIDTSINFAARISQPKIAAPNETPLAPSTLRNADELIERLRIEADILAALENNQFCLLYQPVVCLADNRVVGVEALMRWHHPTLGNIAPDRFIEIAETVQSIGALTQFALSEACAAAQRIRTRCPSSAGIFTSVNVSGAEIGKPGFVDFLAFTLDRYDMRPGELKLEVTETSLVQDPKNAGGNLQRLRDLGCGISVDDFGTGYSNLAYLQQLPLTTLKIDRAFVGDAHLNDFSKSIVRMLLELGRQMNVDVIAEGTETDDNARLLQELGCQFAQGYNFHKPLPEEDILALLTDPSQDMRGIA